MTTARPHGGDDVIPPGPATSWSVLVLTTTAVVALTTVLLISSRLLNSLYNDVYRQTAGLVSRTLLFGWLQLALVLWLVTRVARLRLREVGWQWSRIGPGLLTACGIWVAGQLVQLVAVMAGGGVPRLSDEWSGGGGVAAVGVLLAQLLGIAPAEETFFRGFLLVQLGAQLSRWSPAIAVGGAVVVSQLVFALFHLPNLVLGGSAGVGRAPSAVAVQLSLDFVIGVVFGLLYLQTGNLFLVIGVHALQNAGTSLVAPPLDPAQVMLWLSVIVCLLTFVPSVGRRFRQAGGNPASGVPPG